MLDSSLSWSPGDSNEKNLDLVLLSTSCTRAQPGAGCSVRGAMPPRPPGQTVRYGSTCAGYRGHLDSRRGSERGAPRGWRILLKVTWCCLTIVVYFVCLHHSKHFFCEMLAEILACLLLRFQYYSLLISVYRNQKNTFCCIKIKISIEKYSFPIRKLHFSIRNIVCFLRCFRFVKNYSL